MAKNKITFKKDYGEDGRCEYTFAGSQREPTIGEVLNFIIENRLQDEMDDYFAVTSIRLKDVEWLPPEESKSITFWGYDGGSNYGSCPICGHERDMSRDVCPVCLKKWE